ncbi:putative metal-binding protein [Chitinivorax tropicus]|uniref:Putative metal-binding protein n=1 Tax=Chitinivorax tropicus TaxID=714531 RepID=A0A840MJH8_9PROT|nr:putative metal-binding protein [Chitinivorax tropicus]
MKTNTIPLVYACSGCSSAAQLANHLALKLDRTGIAEMSCIAGVGGGVPGLVRTAQSGRPILALDGCIMHCVAACLARAGVEPDSHLTLSAFGVKKQRHTDFDVEQAAQLWPWVEAAAREINQVGLAQATSPDMQPDQATTNSARVRSSSDNCSASPACNGPTPSGVPV